MEEKSILFTEAAEKLRLNLNLPWYVPKREYHSAIMIGGGINIDMNEIDKETAFGEVAKIATSIGKAAIDLQDPNFTHSVGDTVFHNDGPLKDSGTRDVFSTGAVRDADATKGRMDLVPMDVVGDIVEYDAGHTDFSKLYSEVAALIDQLNWSQDTTPAYQAVCLFGKKVFGNLIEAVNELSIHYRDGALKYEEHNWRKGIPLFRYVDSAERHLGKWYRGDKDEPHHRAVLWNLVCYIWTVDNFSVDNEEICNLPWCKREREQLKKDQERLVF
jgi:hypothetical protein